MKNRYDLRRKIGNSLSMGIEISEDMYRCYDNSHYCLLGKELDSARNWMAGINDLSESEILEGMPEIVELIRECARVAKSNELVFLPADFENTAKIVEKALESELESTEGEANTSY
jgi:hypothetical protein